MMYLTKFKYVKLKKYINYIGYVHSLRKKIGMENKMKKNKNAWYLEITTN